MIDRGWKYYPALKALLPLAAGIVVSRLTAPPLGWPLLTLSFATLWLGIEMRRDGRAILPAFLSVMFLSGTLLHTLGSGSAMKGLEGIRIAGVEIIGRIAAEPVVRGNRIEYVVECDSMLYRNSSVHPGTNVLVRLYDTTTGIGTLPGYGDHISVIGTVSVPERPSVPGMFDYSLYLRSRGIEFTCNVSRASSVHTIRREDISPLEQIVLPIRRAARTFARETVGGEEGDIVRALLLGEREYIDESTREAFVRTGTIHVLAVSGLHVGVIALGLFVLVSWIPNRVAQTVIYTLAIVLYVEVAGAGPSIVRAAFMAVMFMTARTIERIPRPINTLSLAALVMLLVQPEALFDIGFQLSFAAVAGIIMIHAPLRHAVTDRLRWLRRSIPKRIIELLLLSVSAQLFTFPLQLHYFGQVSTIALPINLLVVPLISIALGSAVLGVLTAPLTSLSIWFGGTAYLAVGISERLVAWGASALPGNIAGQPIGLIATLPLLGAGFYLGLSRHTPQLLLRGLTLILATFCVVSVDRFVDPLRESGPNYLYLIPSRKGIIVATHEHDTLTIRYSGRESGSDQSLRYISDALCARLGTDRCRIVDLDSLTVETEKDLIEINTGPREYALRALPVLLSLTGNRPPGLVRIGSERFVQVPIQRELERTVVLRYRLSNWERIEWD